MDTEKMMFRVVTGPQRSQKSRRTQPWHSGGSIRPLLPLVMHEALLLAGAQPWKPRSEAASTTGCSLDHLPRKPPGAQPHAHKNAKLPARCIPQHPCCISCSDSQRELHMWLTSETRKPARAWNFYLAHQTMTDEPPVSLPRSGCAEP